MTNAQYDKHVEELVISYDNEEITYEEFNRFMAELYEEYLEGETQ